jgi:hypothetical protein
MWKRGLSAWVQRRYGAGMNSTTTTTGQLRVHPLAPPNILT